MMRSLKYTLAGVVVIILTACSSSAQAPKQMSPGDVVATVGSSNITLAEVDDKPGGMARIARQLADAGVNIHGHLFLGRWGDRAMFAFVVDRPDLAKPILERKG